MDNQPIIDASCDNVTSRMLQAEQGELPTNKNFDDAHRQVDTPRASTLRISSATIFLD